MARLIDAAPLLEVTVPVGAGLVVPQALPAGGRFLKFSGHDTVLSAPAAGLIARVQRALPLAVRASYDDRHYGAELPVPQDAPVPDTFELDNVAGPNAVDVHLQVYQVFDPAALALAIALAGNPRLAPLGVPANGAFGPVAPAGALNLNVGPQATHNLVVLDEVAGAAFTLEWYEGAVPVLVASMPFTNALVPFAEQDQYARCWPIAPTCTQFTFRNTGMVPLSGRYYLFAQY